MDFKQFCLRALRFIIAFFIIVDEIIRPIYKPIVDRFAALTLVERAEIFIAKMPRFFILLAFVVPFAIAEPLKIYALIKIAEGHVIWGVLILILAYLASFLLVERIYHAGKPKLLSYEWFAWIMLQVGYVNDLLAPIRHGVRESVKAIKTKIFG